MRKVRVLWAEDDHVALRNLVDPYNPDVIIEPASTYAEARDAIRQKPRYDIFVIDVLLEFSGVEEHKLPQYLREEHDNEASRYPEGRTVFWGIPLIKRIVEEVQPIPPIIVLSAVLESVPEADMRALPIVAKIQKVGLKRKAWQALFLPVVEEIQGQEQ